MFTSRHLRKAGITGKIHDVVIVGSGPAGWTAAIYTARAGFEPLVVVGVLEAGGALMNIIEVENFPGWPDRVMGPDLMDKFRAQARKFSASVEYEDATELQLEGDVRTVVTDSSTYKAKTVIPALGSIYRKPGLEGERLYSGKGVSYCAMCDSFLFKDREIAVVGGGDPALTEAFFPTRFGSRVHLTHRRDQFWMSKVLADCVAADPKIEIHWNKTVSELSGDETLEFATLANTITGETPVFPVTGLFVAIGHDPRTALVRDEVALDGAGYILIEEPSIRTNVPGVFAAGDAVDHTYRQAITVAGSEAHAAPDAQVYLEDLHD